jgi:hypothetical protein
MNNGEIEFTDCGIPADHLLALDDALGKAGVYFQPGKILQGAKNLGIGLAAFEETGQYVQDRVQGGRPLVQHQAVALRLAQMSIKLDAASALVRQAARAVDEGWPEANRLCNEAKVFTSQEVFEVCTNAMELHGGSGSMIETGIEKYLRDASVFLHMDATVDISCFKIVKELFPETAGTYAG